MLDAEDLKAVGISTVGQRLAILKAVYQAKLAHHVPVEADHYIPPCAHFCDDHYSKR
jgi:bZIP factor